MYNLLQDSYILHKTPEGSTLEFKFNTTLDELFYGKCTDKISGYEYVIPDIGDPFNFTSKNFTGTLHVTDISNKNITGLWEKDVNTGNSIVDPQHLVTEVTITYSDIQSKIDKKRINQASSWWIKWDCQLEDIDQECYYKLTSITDDSYAGAWRVWGTDYFTSAGAALKTLYGFSDDDITEMKKNKNYPRLSYKQPILYVTVTAYTDQLRGQLFAKSVGKVNSVGFMDWTYEQRKAGVQKLMRPGIYTEAGSDIAIDANPFLDTGCWLMMHFQILEKAYGMFEYIATYRFKVDGWNSANGITINMYKTMDFRTLYSGMARTEPLDENGNIITNDK
jgi:hypothetical protein